MSRLITLLCVIVAVGHSQGLGDRLTRSFGNLVDLPLTSGSARQQGWVLGANCHPKLGFRATQGPDSTRSQPVSLYYSARGQLSGYAVDLWGSPATMPATAGFLQRVGNIWRLSLGFRERDPCSSASTYRQPVGDTLFVLNSRGGADWSVPLTNSSARARGYTKGACISKMGTHWAYDMRTRDGTMSWDADTLFPLIPMYDTDGSLTGVLLPSKSLQFQFLYRPNQHDAVFIPNFAMCLNFCDKDCHWENHDRAIWSTMHVFFRESRNIACPEKRCPGSRSWINP